jgi:hypothetical protein
MTASLVHRRLSHLAISDSLQQDVSRATEGNLIQW